MLYIMYTVHFESLILSRPFSGAQPPAGCSAAVAGYSLFNCLKDALERLTLSNFETSLLSTNIMLVCPAKLIEQLRSVWACALRKSFTRSPQKIQGGPPRRQNRT